MLVRNSDRALATPNGVLALCVFGLLACFSVPNPRAGSALGAEAAGKSAPISEREETWTVVLFWDKLKLGDEVPESWEAEKGKLENFLKFPPARTKDEKTAGDAIRQNFEDVRVEPLSESKFDPMTFTDPLFDGADLVPYRDPSSAWSRPCSWVFEVESPLFKRVRLESNEASFVIDWPSQSNDPLKATPPAGLDGLGKQVHLAARITPKENTSPRIHDGRITQTWRVEVPSAPMLLHTDRLRSGDPAVKLKIDLEDGATPLEQPVEVRIKLNESTQKMVAVRRLIIRYCTPQHKTPVLAAFNNSGDPTRKTFQVKEPILFIPVSSLESVETEFITRLFATAGAGPCFYIPISQRKDEPNPPADQLPQRLSTGTWSNCEPSPLSELVKNGGDAGEGQYGWAVKISGHPMQHKGLVVCRNADAYEALIVGRQGSKKPERLIVDQKQLQALWSEAQAAAPAK
jgi:hypothetical protein